MAFTDFLPKRRIVQSRDGRRFVCRPPTHATIVRLLEVMPSTIIACAEVVKSVNGTGDPFTPQQLMPLFLADRTAAAEVFATCCELSGGAPGDLELAVAHDERLAIELGQALLELCDPVRIAKELNLDAIAEAQVEGEPDGIEATYVLLAERFGISPLEIPAWPYEALLSVRDAVTHIEEKRDAASRGQRPTGKVLAMRSDGPAIPSGGVARVVRRRQVRRG